MSSGPSLYRRHRPRTFDDVVGQEHVVRTLRNAVEQDRVHHAYLFVGSRGTGKTSMAKILAACLNCEHGPTVSPCGVCDSCRAIAEATSLDVIEMDAASNNSVDDIRALRETVAYAPVSGRSKVYILDEAHMLSAAAWNAFLKTLEEPPPNTVFVLATTEAQKVLPTVVDRCHRFDFSRPTADQIALVLRRAAEAEGIELPDEAAALLARHATGSFRDALGTLEQLTTYGGSTVAVGDVLAVLGVTDGELLFAAVDAVAAGDVRGALVAVARLAESGRDAARFFRDLEAHARELLIVQTLGDVPASLRLTEERDQRLAEQAARVGRPLLVRLLDLLADGLAAMKDGADPRTRLELALVKAAAPDSDPSRDALLARIARLESQVGGGAPIPAPPPAPSGAVAAPAVVVVAAGAPGSPPAQPAVADAEGAAEPRPVAVAVAGSGPAPVRSGPAPVLADPPVPVAVVPPASPDQPLDLAGVRAIWPAVVETVRADNAMLAALVEAARPIAVTGNSIRLGFDPTAAFLKRKAEDRANREIVTAAVATIAGRRPELAYELVTEGDRPEEDAAAPPDADEWFARFLAEFDGEELDPTAADHEDPS